MTRILACIVFIIGSVFLGITSSYAFDDARDSTVDKADHFDFEEFHKDSAVTVWDKNKDKDKKEEQKTIDKDQELKVRSAYKLSADPTLAAIPTLFDAIQDLHKQLNSLCPKGWEKKDEWHLPEANYFYIHYRAKCL
jgi:hypothetical protein